MAVTSPPRGLRTLRTTLDDALYRGSLYLLVNNVALAALGFAFWTLAAHRYAASTVGVFSGVTSGASLLAAIAALGLPITMTRHIAGAEDQRGLVLMAILVIPTVGTALCFATVLILGPHLPSAIHIDQHGRMALLVTVLVVFTAAGTTLDAGLVAVRSSRVVLIKNLAGSIVKLLAMLLLTTLQSSGLLISFSLGLVLATTLSCIALGRRTRGGSLVNPLRVSWHYLSVTSGNYLATVIGILPLSIVPIEVLAARGAAETAGFSIAFLIASFLNFIPSTTGQVLFAEIARGEVPLGQQLRKALRAVYGLLLPSVALLLALAPFVLRLFGRAYAAEATGCLRLLVLSALPAGGTYLISSLLIARDRIAAYTFLQAANAVLILGCVGILLRGGLTDAAGGFALGQAMTLVVCLLLLPTGRIGRHHPQAYAVPTGQTSAPPRHEGRRAPQTYAFESQITELLASWPLMPTTLIADRIRWDKPIDVLLDRVIELRSAYSHTYARRSPASYPPGETAQCSIWYPPTQVPVGFGQTRSARQLPVLTMITGYSRWLSAVLIPSTCAEDLFAAWWELIAELGAVPRRLVTHGEHAIGWRIGGQAHLTSECAEFCRRLSTEVVIGQAGHRLTSELIERAHANLERSFLYHRAFSSPPDFNAQLRDWLTVINTRHREPPRYSPAALIAADRKAMRPLPSTAPAIGWKVSMRVGQRPLIQFDGNDYAVDPVAIGRMVELSADLSQIRVVCGTKVVANHDRVWARGLTIHDSFHGSVTRRLLS